MPIYKGGTGCPGRLMVKMSSDASTYLMRKMTAKTARTCKVRGNAQIILHCMKKDTRILKVILICQQFLLKMMMMMIDDR